LLGIVLALLVAVPLAWMLYRQWELTSLLEVPPAVEFELENGRELYARLLGSDAWRTLRATPAAEGFWEGTTGREVESIRHGLTVVLDDDPIELLVRAFGRRAQGALWLRPSGGVAVALVAVPEEGTDVADLAKRIGVLAKTNKRIRIGEIQGMPTVDLGGDALVLGNGVVALASSDDMAARVAREWKERVANAAPGSARLHFEIDPTVAQLAKPGPAEGGGGVISLIFAGGIARALHASKHVTASLDPIQGGVRFAVHIDAGLAALDERARRIYAPTTRAPAPVAPGEILRAEVARDLDVLWQDRRARIAPETMQMLGEVEDMISAQALFRSLFTGLEPGVTLHVAPQTWDEDWPKPESPFPGVAISARMREPERLGPRFERAFESLVELANEDPADRHQPPLLLGEVAGLEGIELLRARFAVPPAGGASIPDSMRNLTPSFGHRGAALALSSSASLAQQLLAAEPAPLAENTPRDTLRIDARNLEAALRTARVALIQNQVEQGTPLHRAEQDFDALLAILGALDRLDAEIAYHDAETLIALELRERAATEARSERAADEVRGLAVE
jgi:hypothetical protein